LSIVFILKRLFRNMDCHFGDLAEEGRWKAEEEALEQWLPDKVAG